MEKENKTCCEKCKLSGERKYDCPCECHQSQQKECEHEALVIKGKKRFCVDCHKEVKMVIPEQKEDWEDKFDKLDCFFCLYFNNEEHTIKDCPRYSYYDIKDLIRQLFLTHDQKILKRIEERFKKNFSDKEIMWDYTPFREIKNIIQEN